MVSSRVLSVRDRIFFDVPGQTDYGIPHTYNYLLHGLGAGIHGPVWSQVLVPIWEKVIENQSSQLSLKNRLEKSDGKER